MSMEHYLQELQELRGIVAEQTRDIALLRRAGGTATWLDRCAWAAMQGLCLLSGDMDDLFTHDVLARHAYDLAAAMLAEKRKREGGKHQEGSV